MTSPSPAKARGLTSPETNMTTVPNDIIPAAPMPNAVTDTGQMQWRMSINYGPDGEENYANVYDAIGDRVGNLKTHHAREIVRLATLEADAGRGEAENELTLRCAVLDEALTNKAALLSAAIARAEAAEAELEALRHSLDHKRFVGLMTGPNPAEVWKSQAVKLAHELDPAEAKLAAPVVEVERLKREAFTAGWDWARTMSGINFTDEPAPVVEDGKAWEEADDYYTPDASGYSRADEEWFFDGDGKP